MGRDVHRRGVAGWLVPAAMAVALGLVAGACSTDGLTFVDDGRFRIENLEDRTEIALPFEVRWRHDGELPGDAVAFAVLVDWTPPPPGRALASLLDDDPVCDTADGCPDGYLERNRISTVQGTSFLVENVAVGTADEERRGFHELTVVLVDAEGRRVGERAAFVRFRVPGRER